MDVYWSVQLCGWTRCPAAPDPLATPWSAREVEPELIHVPPPRQAAEEARLLRT